MSELTTKDSGGWVPLMFASRSGNRFVFVAAMQAFIDQGEEGSCVVGHDRAWGKRLWGKAVLDILRII